MQNLVVTAECRLPPHMVTTGCSQANLEAFLSAMHQRLDDLELASTEMERVSASGGAPAMRHAAPFTPGARGATPAGDGGAEGGVSRPGTPSRLEIGGVVVLPSSSPGNDAAHEPLEAAAAPPPAAAASGELPALV